jgi:signal-induced proliferation-associated 1 like protein 3
MGLVGGVMLVVVETALPLASVVVDVSEAGVPVRNAVASASALSVDPANDANGAATRPATWSWPPESVGVVVVPVPPVPVLVPVPVALVPVPESVPVPVPVPPVPVPVAVPPVLPVPVPVLVPVPVPLVVVVVLPLVRLVHADDVPVAVPVVNPGPGRVAVLGEVCAATKPDDNSAAASKFNRIVLRVMRALLSSGGSTSSHELLGLQDDFRGGGGVAYQAAVLDRGDGQARRVRRQRFDFDCNVAVGCASLDDFGAALVLRLHDPDLHTAERRDRGAPHLRLRRGERLVNDAAQRVGHAGGHADADGGQRNGRTAGQREEEDDRERKPE